MSVFQFKQFTVYQEGAAMKVGTDGVLLGAWASEGHLPLRILDIGTGSGVIALMLAQRFTQAVIDAVELDANAAQQAHENFLRSPWAERLHMYVGDIREVRAQLQMPYDLIVSNPPYFSKGWPVDHAGRHKARVAEQLPPEVLLHTAKQLLQPNGRLAVILPEQESMQFTSLAFQEGLHLKRRTLVYTRPQKPVKRILSEWVLHPAEVIESALSIHDREGDGYTEGYISLTKDFYLAF